MEKLKSIEIYNINYRINKLPEYLVFNFENGMKGIQDSIDNILKSANTNKKNIDNIWGKIYANTIDDRQCFNCGICLVWLRSSYLVDGYVEYSSNSNTNLDLENEEFIEEILNDIADTDEEPELITSDDDDEDNIVIKDWYKEIIIDIQEEYLNHIYFNTSNEKYCLSNLKLLNDFNGVVDKNIKNTKHAVGKYDNTKEINLITYNNTKGIVRLEIEFM